MNDKSVFSQIIDGEIPSHKVYEDELTYAFLNIHPSVPGHTLVVPKVQVDHLDDLANEDYQAVMATTKKVMKRVKQVLGTKRACLKLEGFDVPHAHVHVIGCDTPADFYQKEDHSQEPDHQQLAQMAKKLYFE